MREKHKERSLGQKIRQAGNQKKRRGYKGVGAVLLTLPVLLTACGGGASQQPKAQSAQSEEAGPLELSIMTITPSSPPAADDNVIKRAIEKATNSNMNIQWVSNNIYKDKLNLTLASGQIPDLTFISDPFSSSFRSLVNQGVFWDISPYIKDYPNLQKGIPSIAWELTKLDDGKNYGIPRARDENDESFFIIRRDWLDKLGLKPPTTTDELYQVMKAFVEQDPDGNGKQDTVALAASITPDDASNWGGVGPCSARSRALLPASTGNGSSTATSWSTRRCCLRYGRRWNTTPKRIRKSCCRKTCSP
ncbi:extracellular solute-binding protein [Paenibacillus sp. TAB 01]|uniref:extracellular solute-binding protein n=1 Tax=Paenibacillus sp. TAB 01 TaxID=3368988 RepID=UPI0037501CBB